MTSEEIVGLLRKKYSGGEYVVMEQVLNPIENASRNRWIDVAIFSTWSTHGITRSAFEIKVSRSDFIRELQNPDKFQWCMENFHEFWFVGTKDVITKDEVPEGVGWMCPVGERLYIKKHCRRNVSPRLDEGMLAAFMRCAKINMRATEDRVRGEVLKTEPTHLDALLYRKAVMSFLQSRGVQGYLFDATEETIRGALEKATLDKQLVQDRDHLLIKLGEFQGRIADLFNLFAVIAHKALLERSELGQYIISRYGGYDEESLQAIRERKKDKWNRKAKKDYLEVIETILNWEQK